LLNTFCSNKLKIATFKKPENMRDYEWEVGTYFLSKKEFQDIVRTFVVHSGRDVKFDKNDKRRVKVICQQQNPTSQQQNPTGAASARTSAQQKRTSRRKGKEKVSSTQLGANMKKKVSIRDKGSTSSQH